MTSSCEVCGYVHDEQTPHNIDGLVEKVRQPRSLFADVRRFHQKFDLPTHPQKKPSLLEEDVFDFRMNFMYEELGEFRLGYLDNDIEKMGDALIDLVYVALGTAHMMGLPFDEMWKEVQRANMAKERCTSADDPRNTRLHAFNVVKPAGWKAPDHRPIIDQAIEQWDKAHEQEDLSKQEGEK